MCGRVGCIFSNMIRLELFKLTFDKTLKENNRVSVQRYLEERRQGTGTAVRSCLPVQGGTRKQARCGWRGG